MKKRKMILLLISIILFSSCSSFDREQVPEIKFVSIDDIRKEYLLNEMDIPFSDLIDLHCQGLDPFLVAAVMKMESNFNPYAVSSKGAVGLMQNIPQISTVYSFQELKKPSNSVAAGCKYLLSLKQIFHDDTAVLTAYNHGMGKMLTYKSWSTDYSRAVMKQRDIYYEDFKSYLQTFYGFPQI